MCQILMQNQVRRVLSFVFDDSESSPIYFKLLFAGVVQESNITVVVKVSNKDKVLKAALSLL